MSDEQVRGVADFGVHELGEQVDDVVRRSDRIVQLGVSIAGSVSGRTPHPRSRRAPDDDITQSVTDQLNHAAEELAHTEVSES